MFSFPRFDVGVELESFVLERRNSSVSTLGFPAMSRTSSFLNTQIGNACMLSISPGIKFDTKKGDKFSKDRLYNAESYNHSPIAVLDFLFHGEIPLNHSSILEEGTSWAYSVIAEGGKLLGLENGRTVGEKVSKALPEVFFGGNIRETPLLHKAFEKGDPSINNAYEGDARLPQISKEELSEKAIYLDCNISLNFHDISDEDHRKLLSDVGQVKTLIKLLDILVALPSTLISPKSYYKHRRVANRPAGRFLYLNRSLPGARNEVAIMYTSLSPWWGRACAFSKMIVSNLYLGTKLFFNPALAKLILNEFPDEVLLSAINGYDTEALSECKNRLIFSIPKLPAALGDANSLTTGKNLARLLFISDNRKTIGERFVSNRYMSSKTLENVIKESIPENSFLEFINSSPLREYGD